MYSVLGRINAALGDGGVALGVAALDGMLRRHGRIGMVTDEER